MGWEWWCVGSFRTGTRGKGRGEVVRGVTLSTSTLLTTIRHTFVREKFETVFLGEILGGREDEERGLRVETTLGGDHTGIRTRGGGGGRSVWGHPLLPD